MKEQLISFETAKLAKEKGFNLRCQYGCMIGSSDVLVETKNHQLKFSVPTQSLLQKWLRESKNLDMRIYRDYQFLIKNKNEESKYYDSVEYGSYEEALEKGLQKALKLIEV